MAPKRKEEGHDGKTSPKKSKAANTVKTDDAASGDKPAGASAGAKASAWTVGTGIHSEQPTSHIFTHRYVSPPLANSHAVGKEAEALGQGRQGSEYVGDEVGRRAE